MSGTESPDGDASEPEDLKALLDDAVHALEVFRHRVGSAIETLEAVHRNAGEKIEALKWARDDFQG